MQISRITSLFGTRWQKVKLVWELKSGFQSTWDFASLCSENLKLEMM